MIFSGVETWCHCCIFLKEQKYMLNFQEMLRGASSHSAWRTTPSLRECCLESPPKPSNGLESEYYCPSTLVLPLSALLPALCSRVNWMCREFIVLVNKGGETGTHHHYCHRGPVTSSQAQTGVLCLTTLSRDPGSDNSSRIFLVFCQSSEVNYRNESSIIILF